MKLVHILFTLELQRFLGFLARLQVPSTLGSDKHVLEVNVRDNCTVVLFDGTFVTVNFGDLKRSRGRFLIWSFPPSLSMPRVSEDNEVTHAYRLIRSKTVGATDTVVSQFVEMAESANADLAIVTENVRNIIAEWFKF